MSETRAEHRKHRCMRCGDEFDCTAPGCVALYDVLPTMIRDGIVVEHECRMVSIPLSLARRILAVLEAVPWASHTDELAAVRAELREKLPR